MSNVEFDFPKSGGTPSSPFSAKENEEKTDKVITMRIMRE
jgi:hypothetical protein